MSDFFEQVDAAVAKWKTFRAKAVELAHDLGFSRRIRTTPSGMLVTKCKHCSDEVRGRTLEEFEAALRSEEHRRCRNAWEDRR